MVNFIRSRSRPKLYIGTAFLTLLMGLTGPVAAEPVAIVTDLSGKISVPGDPKKSSVTILAEIDVDTKLKLEDGARLVVLYTRLGDEYALSGPALIQFKAAELVALSGAKPQKRASPLGKSVDIRIKPAGITQAAFVMRGGSSAARIKLLSLSGTRTLDPDPEFRWQEIQPGAKYRFGLYDDTGRSLYETDAEATSLKLPPSIQLREGMVYTWDVSTRQPDGRRYVNSGNFSVAPADLRAQAAALRPAPDAPVSSRVAVAAWLDQMELRDEARKYWHALAVERPEDVRLKALAGG